MTLRLLFRQSVLHPIITALVALVGVEPTKPRFWVAYVCQFRHSAIKSTKYKIQSTYTTPRHCKLVCVATSSSLSPIPDTSVRRQNTKSTIVRHLTSILFRGCSLKPAPVFQGSNRLSLLHFIFSFIYRDNQYQLAGLLVCSNQLNTNYSYL